MSTLSAPGARLYYETHGSGPLMLMIAGASGSDDPFKRAADYLAARHTVVIYDRRGFSRERAGWTAGLHPSASSRRR